jgi:hypothetical protein
MLVLSVAQLPNIYCQQLSRTGTETVEGAAPFDGFCAWKDGGTLPNCTQLLAESTSSHTHCLGDFRIFSCAETMLWHNITVSTTYQIDCSLVKSIVNLSNLFHSSVIERPFLATEP